MFFQGLLRYEYNIRLLDINTTVSAQMLSQILFDLRPFIER
jgi:hypothetical protein